jgi:hypothetical protein
MNRFKIAAVALAVGLGMTLFGGAAVASPAAGDGGIGVQCTRQYIVTVQDLELRWWAGGPGNGVIGFAGDKFNVADPSGSWYQGNLYSPAGNFRGSGFTLAANLVYTGKCF